jgi:hypothetical protein
MRPAYPARAMQPSPLLSFRGVGESGVPAVKVGGQVIVEDPGVDLK